MIGIICGLRSEIATLGPWARHPLVRVGASGARPEVATALCEQFRKDGARTLISWGIAGGLDPSQGVGTLILPRNVVDTRDGTEFSVNEGMPLHADAKGTIVGIETMADSCSDKHGLAGRFCAAAVDMESHRVASFATHHGLACNVVRAVADPVDFALPEAATNAVDDAGRVRTLAVSLSILRKPGQLADLIRLWHYSRQAHRSLTRAGQNHLPSILNTLLEN